MNPRQLDLLICTYSYGGNGGVASTSPALRDWFWDLRPKLEADERIGSFLLKDLVDTPITMTRNQSVVLAREFGADLLLMVDSDTWPDYHLTVDPVAGAKPFWQTSLDFLYERFDRGPYLIAAPYCGPPPHENVYIFCWANYQSGHPNDDMHLEGFSRHEAAEMTGIQEAAALPTGLSLWDMRLFDLTEPKQEGDRPWFDYDYIDRFCAEKATTEDVFATREVSMAGLEQLGYNPICCNWDAWAGHIKQKVVGRPRLVTPDIVSKAFARAVRERLPANLKRGFQESKIAGEIDWSKATRAGFEGAEEGNGRWKTSPSKIGGLEVVSVGFQTGEKDLEILGALSRKAYIRKYSGGVSPPVRFLEVGSWVGESALAMALGAKGGAILDIYCVDHWCGSGTDDTRTIADQFGGRDQLFRRFCQNVGEYLLPEWRPRIIPQVVLDHIDAARNFPDGHFALIFLDAGHTETETETAIQVWFPKLAAEGVICGHDYHNPAYPGVKAAVDRCFGESAVEHPGGTYLWIVDSPGRNQIQKAAEVQAE